MNEVPGIPPSEVTRLASWLACWWPGQDHRYRIAADLAQFVAQGMAHAQAVREVEDTILMLVGRWGVVLH